MSFDWKPFQAAISTLARPKLDQAVALALADTAKSANGKAASAISKHTGLKVKDVKKALFYDHVSVGDYTVNLRATTRLIPLIDFTTRQTNQGVRAAKPWGHAQVFHNTFYATMKSGHRGIFRRETRRRLPIHEMMGPSIHGSFVQQDVRQIIEAATKKRMPSFVARRIRQMQRRR
jgi:hypothetical protein